MISYDELERVSVFAAELRDMQTQDDLQGPAYKAAEDAFIKEMKEGVEREFGR